MTCECVDQGASDGEYCTDFVQARCVATTSAGFACVTMLAFDVRATLTTRRTAGTTARSSQVRHHTYMAMMMMEMRSSGAEGRVATNVAIGKIQKSLGECHERPPGMDSCRAGTTRTYEIGYTPSVECRSALIRFDIVCVSPR